MANPAFDMVDLFRLIELSNKIEVSLVSPTGEMAEDFGDCSFCLKEGSGFAFALMSELKCLEFYAASAHQAHVFIYGIGADEPQGLGEGNTESMTSDSGSLVCSFDFSGYKLKIKLAQHMLKAIPENFDDYMSQKGDKLGLKWLNERNVIDRLKFEMARRDVSVGRIEGDKVVEMCKRANLHSLKVGGPEVFTMEIHGVHSDEKTNIQINMCDENTNVPENKDYQKLLYSIIFTSENDINVLRGCEVRRKEADDFITYFFNKDDDSIAIIIHKIKSDESQPYKMFDAVEYES